MAHSQTLDAKHLVKSNAPGGGGGELTLKCPGVENSLCSNAQGCLGGWSRQELNETLSSEVSNGFLAGILQFQIV